jgi:membrane protein implicated in regulation of membrane protease activity
VIVAWLVLGVALLLFELHHMAFYALFGSAGAFAGAAVAYVAPDAIPLQTGAAVGVAVVGVVAMRPYLSKTFHHRRDNLHVARGVHGGLVGQEAITLDEVGQAHHVGHVRLAGERWLAVSGGATIPTGTPVLVMAVQGTTLLVWPLDGVAGAPPAIDPATNDVAPDGADGRTT